ncbi:hypothetical protein S83_006102 [Arachis hypogaea]|nr:pentatricopeptide repeat-containing protein PPR5 homolog, chloroplastic-like [Arachis hypogaea]XP_025636071.1 pentatricopeptide repeat-containing protein PPR5 homolog, chloroplastic-like [Arachis hypogaea]XP_025636591.1 pentatricopeptide repeat-containing protein PPR5 homolog, chloroplastic-like [Arachis hypogaea]XP_025636592.1 pentatricopeptide repeat-containing protein PPR5 homolog, chloroplastic-like [Arachis hypogaea]QHO26296.1 Pentatricopeptide repeat-containing protein [Arachis hypogae
MEQVFKSLLRSKEKPTLPTFNSMILNYGKARLKEKAENVFRKMTDMVYKPSFITYKSLIYIYGYCDCISKARDLFEGLIESKSQIKASTLSVMLDVYRINGLPLEADSLLERAITFQVFPDASTYKLLRVYTKANLKELVDKLLRHMDRDGIIPNKKFFLDALGSSRDKSKSAITAVTHSNSFAEPQLNT